MASSGPNSPTASAQIVATWTSYGNVYSSDNNRANSTSTSAIMAATGFGFSIDNQATILGILIEVEGYGSGSQAARRGLSASPTKDGTSKAGDTGAQTDLTTTTPETSYRSWGSSTDMWGTTWTPAQINASTFGVLLQPAGTTGYARYVDHVRVTVYYLDSDKPSVSDGVTVGESGTVQREDATLPDRDVSVYDSVTKTEIAPTILNSELILVTSQGVTKTELTPTLLVGELALVTSQGVTKTEVSPLAQVEDKPPLSITLTAEHAYATESSPTLRDGDILLVTTQGVTKTEVAPTLSFGDMNLPIISEGVDITELQPSGRLSELFFLSTQGVSLGEVLSWQVTGGGGLDINVEVNSNMDVPDPEDWLEYKRRVYVESMGMGA